MGLRLLDIRERNERVEASQVVAGRLQNYFFEISR